MSKVKVKMFARQDYRTIRSHEDGSEWTTRDGASVEASTELGQRWWHTHKFESVESAYQFISHVYSCGGMIDPSKSCWVEGDPVYGSADYQRGGYEQMWAERERLEDAWN